MFGIGGDDKDKLKENMEDIKEMVNNSTPADKSADQEREVEELEEEFSEGFEEQATPGNQIQNNDNTQSFSPDQQAQEQGDIPQSDSESFDERFQSEESPEQQDFSQNQADQQETREEHVESFEEQDSHESVDTGTPSRSQQEEPSNSPSSRASRLDESIPEPAETKDINVPDIDKGPLFIRRKKFESAKNMIEEMRYISREIEDVVNQLERGIEEDQKTEQEAKELLHNLEKDRSSVKSIISQQDSQQE